MQVALNGASIKRRRKMLKSAKITLIARNKVVIQTPRIAKSVTSISAAVPPARVARRTLSSLMEAGSAASVKITTSRDVWGAIDAIRWSQTLTKMASLNIWFASQPRTRVNNKIQDRITVVVVMESNSLPQLISSPKRSRTTKSSPLRQLWSRSLSRVRIKF